MLAALASVGRAAGLTRTAARNNGMYHSVETLGPDLASLACNTPLSCYCFRLGC